MACLPTALFTSLCIAGGALTETNGSGFYINPKMLAMGIVLLSIALLFIVLVTWGSISRVGLAETVHYTIQKFERDNVSSWGGCWNQFVPSNIVIGLGSVAAGKLIGTAILMNGTALSQNQTSSAYKIIVVAILFFISLSIIFKTGRRSFMEPRWLAHSIREIATYPLTTVPAGLGAILLVCNVQNVKYGVFTVSLFPVVIFVIAVVFFLVQLIILRKTDVKVLSQKPAFAPNGLPVPYLLASHVFEHTTDIIFIAIITPSFYIIGLVI